MWFFKKKYPENRKKDKVMGCVYAGPDYFEKESRRMAGVYAGPEMMNKGMFSDDSYLKNFDIQNNENVSAATTDGSQPAKKKFCNLCGAFLDEEGKCPECDAAKSDGE